METQTFFKGSKKGGFLAGAKHQVPVRHTIIVSKDIPIARPLSKLLSELQGLPDLGGVPLRTASYFPPTDVRYGLETEAKKSGGIDPAKFTVPASYKQVKNISEVTSRDPSVLTDFLK